MSDERLPHIAILAKPVEYKKEEKIHFSMRQTCSYCGKSFKAVATSGSISENLETGEQTYSINGWMSYEEECAERIKQERAISRT